MGKLALVMERVDAPIQLNLAMTAIAVSHEPGYWDGIATRLVDRAVCETDESTLQLIPYIMLIAAPAPEGERYSLFRPRFFTYSRGKGGEEARLHGALSIGLGGHIDGQVPDNVKPKGWFSEEAARELNEEVGLTVHASEVVFADTLIYDPTNPVGRVHAGILCAVLLGNRELGATEAEVVEHAQWLTLEQLLDAAVFARLEPWSQAAVKFMENDRRK